MHMPRTFRRYKPDPVSNLGTKPKFVEVVDPAGEVMVEPFEGWESVLEAIEYAHVIAMREGAYLCLYPVRPCDVFRGAA